MKKGNLYGYHNLDVEYIVTDRLGDKLIMASVIGKVDDLKGIKKNKHKTSFMNFRGINENGSSSYLSLAVDSNMNMKTKKMPKTSVGHALLYKDDCVRDDGHMEFVILYSDEEDLDRKLYSKLYQHTAIPIKEEWSNYIRLNLASRNDITLCRIFYGIQDYSIKYKACLVRTNKSRVLRIVQDGIRNDAISFSESKEVSPLMQETQGLDAYLNLFGDILASKIQDSFVPKFIPDEDAYTQGVDNFDDSSFHNGKIMYKAQKMAVQATNNNLKENDTSFIIAEMGFGKSLIAAGSVYSNYYDTTGNKAGLKCIVICPGHILPKWKREIEETVPNSVGYIISSFEDLKANEFKIKYPNPKENSFFIISRDAAKSSYERRPAVAWSNVKREYKCPCCGKVLKKKVKRSFNTIEVKLDVIDIMKESSLNKVCESCGEKLWGPVNKKELNPKWIKLGKLGWLPVSQVNSLYNEYDARESLSKKEAELFAKLIDAKEAIDDEDITRGLKAPRKYSMAKYIKDNLKFDYCIVDELQDYKGMSAQGQAMADIVRASKKTIAATGTLLNGFADGLFYILYRCFPKLMKREGFEFTDEGKFAKEYGVMKKTNSFSISRSGSQTLTGTKEKRLPGVSPLVFTKFLLENAIFLSLSDLDGGLPAYTEIPIGVDMDQDLSNAYNELERNIRRGVDISRDGIKLASSLTQTLGCYPDCPYNADDLLSDSGETLVAVPSLDPSVVRNKELKLMEIVKDKIEKGEKVLIYTEWTEKTDTQDRLNKALNEAGYKSFILKSSKKNSEREAYIANQIAKGANIMICNPKLVETGLDLLEFTTIVFYQTTYNLFTMRQASRRSWRLSQTKDVEIYFLYYNTTVQEATVGLMATKLQASMALEGNMSEEGLRALSNNEDMLSQIAKSVVEGIKDQVSVKSFAVERTERIYDTSRDRQPMSKLLVSPPLNFKVNYVSRNKKKSNTKKNKVIDKYINNINYLFNVL